MFSTYTVSNNERIGNGLQLQNGLFHIKTTNSLWKKGNDVESLNQMLNSAGKLSVQCEILVKFREKVQH